MMIKTAGGPGLVSPIDFGERRKPLPRATWAAIGVVALAHIAAGAALYYQQFHTPVALSEPDTLPNSISVTFMTPRVETPVPIKPAAPNLPVNDTPTPTTPTETISALTSDTPITASTTLTFDTVVTTPVEDAAPAEIVSPPAAAVINNPQWISRPSGAELMRAYPQRAITDGVAGSATLNCIVRIDGRVGNCTVVRETPGGYGFGRAAQTLSSEFRISPRTVDGRAVEGSRVAIGLRFQMPN